MKAIKLLIAIVLLPVALSAQSNSLYQSLIGLNAEWQNYADVNLSAYSDYSINSDEDLIQLHLLLVHSTLQKKDVQHLNATQLQNRQIGLDNLYRYANYREFPQNITHFGRRPVFIDHRGVHCAVGYLIQQSKHADISEHISNSMNFEYLRKMQDERLGAWVEQSGFTVSELAWIQPGYLHPVNYQTLKGGVDGPVNAIITDNNAGLFVGGKFDTAGQGPAQSIANYFNGFGGFDWMKVGQTGISGEVNDFIYHKGDLYVAGNFYMADTVFVNSGVVKWDGTKWEVVGDFYVGALFNYVLDLEVYRDTLYAGGFFRAKHTVPEYFESVAKWDGSEWVSAGVNLTGEVRKLHVHDKKLIIGGNFQMNMGAPIQNAVMLDSTGVSFFGSGPAVPVNDIETFNNELYIATDFTNQAQTDTMGLAVWRNSAWELLYDGFPYTKMKGGIKALKALPSVNSLVFGGDFHLLNGFTFGYNIGFVRNSNIFNLGSLDSTVTALEEANGNLYIGGHFTQANFGSPVNHIAELALSSTFSLHERKVAEVKVYPNPADGYFIVGRSDTYWESFSLRDVAGRSYEVQPVEHKEGWSIQTSHLAAGTYIISMKAGSTVASQTVIIE